MKKKRLVSAILAGILGVLAIPLSPIVTTVQAAPEDTNHLWITEIYPDDFSRKDTYGTGSDLMEFVEITNTGNEDIHFNEEYNLNYEWPSGDDFGSKHLTVQTVEKTSDVVIKAKTSAVIWSYRPDQNVATIDDFRKAMSIDDTIDVFLVDGQNGFVDDKIRGFAIEKKDGGKIVSHYRYTTDDIANGLSVHLEIPDFGPEMIAKEKKKPVSPGTVYNNQLNGIRLNPVPEDNAPKGLFITEIRPNDIARGTQFGGAGEDDLMEALELTNTTDKDIELNKDYKLYYVIHEGNKEYLPLTNIDGSSDNLVIPAGKTAVVWCDRYDFKHENYSSWPTESDLRTTYNIPDEVKIFSFRNRDGLGNTQRGFEVREVLDNSKEKIVSYYFWDGVNDLKDNKSVHLRVNPDGPKMDVFHAAADSTLGVVEPQQLVYHADDGSKPKLEALEEPDSVLQGNFLRIPYFYEGTDVLPVTSIELYYKTSDMDSYVKNEATSFAIYNKHYVFIPSDVLLNAEYVDYYVKARNAYHNTVTEVRRIHVDKLDNEAGLRVNVNGNTVKDEIEVKDDIRFTAKNFTNPTTSISVSIDNNPVETSASLEKGAFYTFTYTGVDAYFKNALTSGNEIIKLFAKNSEIPSNSSMAIMVDSKYFTYNADGSATAELVIRPGTYGSTWEDNTDENNDDFDINNIALSLTDGTILRPSNFVDEKGNILDPTAIIKMGDSPGKKMQARATFQIPADKINAVGVTIDTKTLSDGEHRVEVKSGDSVQTFKMIVKNQQSEEIIEEEPLKTDIGLSVDASASSVSAQIDVKDSSKATFYETEKLSDIKVYEGFGDSTYNKTVKTDNLATTSESGEFPYQIFEIPFDISKGEQLRFEANTKVDYANDVQLYLLSDKDWIPAEFTQSNEKISAIIPAKDFVSDGKVTILLQARGTEYTPYTKEDKHITTKNNYSDTWDGTGVPEQYDFSFAWMSDTQYYSEQYHDNFTAITDWVLKNRDPLGIEYLIHTGDIVDEWDEEDQYIFADKELAKYDAAKLPYGVLGGNHDTAHGNERFDLYWKYFGQKRYENNPYYGGSYQNNLGHYDLVSAGGVDFVMIYMSWDIYTEEINWINDVLAKYPDRKAILNVHCGINAKGDQSYFSNLLMKEVAPQNKNLIAILNGHYHGSSMNIVGFDDDGDGIQERSVYQICTDYQSAPEGGQGYLKMLYFDIENNKIYMNSYSPVLDDYNYYDSSRLNSYTNGDKFYDQDIAVLDVDLGRQSKSLSVSDATAYQFGNIVLADTNDATKVSILNTEENKKYSVLAALYDNNNKTIGYTSVVDFDTINKDANPNDNSQTPSNEDNKIEIPTDGNSQVISSDVENDVTDNQMKFENSTSENTPKTGDELPLIFMIILNAGAAGILVFMYKNRKRRC